MKKSLFTVIISMLLCQISIAQQANFSKKVFLKNSTLSLTGNSATLDGGALLFGAVNPTNLPSTYTNALLKIDENGKRSWSKSFATNIDQSFIDYALELSNGFSAVLMRDKKLLYLVLLDKNQNVQWSIAIANNGNATLKGVKMMELPNKNMAVLGKNIDNIESFFVFVADIAGNIVFNNQYVHTTPSAALEVSDMNITQQNTIMISYSTNKNFLLSPIVKLPNIVKINPNNGNILWNSSYSFNVPNNQTFEKIYERADGTFVIHGKSQSADPNKTDGVDALITFNQQGIGFNGTVFARNEPRKMNVAQLSDNEYAIVLEKGNANEKYILIAKSNGDVTGQFKEPKKNNSGVNSLSVTTGKSIVFSELSTDCKSENTTNIFKRNIVKKSSCASNTNIKGDKTINFVATNTQIITTQNSSLLLKKMNSNLIINDLNILIGEESSFCPDTINIERCEGDIYQVGQNKYTNSGFYADKIPDNNGCDSIVYTNIKFNAKSNKIDTLFGKICDEKPIKVANVTIPNAGIYDFSLKNKLGCDSIYFIKVTDESIKIDVEKSLKIKAGESQTIFTNPNVSNLKYQWFPTDFLSCSDCENPIITPFKDTKYIVKASNSAGCEAEASLGVTVFGCDKNFIPNAISPNEDGTNDTHVFFTSPCVERIVRYVVYDRWGSNIYEKNDFLPETANMGWDGKYKSQNVEKGVYIYHLMLLLKNGKEVAYSGDLTVF